MEEGEVWWRRGGRRADKVQVQLPIRSFKFSVCAAETFSLQFLIYTQRQQSVKERREGWNGERGRGSREGGVNKSKQQERNKFLSFLPRSEWK